MSIAISSLLALALVGSLIRQVDAFENATVFIAALLKKYVRVYYRVGRREGTEKTPKAQEAQQQPKQLQQ